MADLINNKILIIKGVLAEKCGLHPDLYEELSDLLNDINLLNDAKNCAMESEKLDFNNLDLNTLKVIQFRMSLFSDSTTKTLGYAMINKLCALAEPAKQA